MIDTEYPVDEWNVYCVYMSDGEDFDPDKTIRYIQMMLDRKINMLSYCEIDIDGTWQTYRVLLKAMKKKWKFHTRKESGTTFYKSDKHRFLLSVIKDKSHVFPALKHMLFEKKA